jgi:hypothetical protein
MTLNTFIMNGFLSGILTSLIAGIIFLLLYEFLLKNAFYYLKFSKYQGRFIHHDKNGNPFIHDPDNKPNHVDIKLSFWSPNVLINKAKDYDLKIGKWKTWTGKVTIDILSSEHGIGYYKYETQPYPGIHEIFIVNKNIFFVSIIYYGEKSLPADLQIWCREGCQDEISKLISDYKK